MEQMKRSLMQMEENVKSVQASAVPGLALWGQDKLDQCEGRWTKLSQEVTNKLNLQISIEKVPD